MRYVVSVVALVLGIALTGALTAGPGDDRDAAKDKEKEKDRAAKAVIGDVMFADGSTVRVTLLSESVELETKFGKLTIPAADVLRIDFAFRLSDEQAKKIKEAIGRLAEANFEERESATKDLREIGLNAYPALEEAAKNPDAEVSRRAGQLLAELRERLPSDRLRFPKKDTVQTTEFTVSGKVVSPSLKARTTYFGASDLKIADLRVFQGPGSAGEWRVAVDAAKHGSAANQWMETSVTVERDAPLKITASGQVDLWPQTPGQYMTTPKGYANAAPPAFGGGSLVGKIGEGGSPFLIGEKYDGRASASGKLYLHIIPSPWGNASTGSYDVKVISGDR
jgi:hypothetical protein